MNFIKLHSVLGRVLKFSAVELSAVSSIQCSCIKNEILRTGNASFSTNTSETDPVEGQKKDVSGGYRFTAVQDLSLKHDYKTDAVEYKIKGDPNTFGNLSNDNPIEALAGDEGDKMEESFLENPPDPRSKLRTKQYADMIKKCIQEKRFGDAIDVLETRMLKKDRVKPETYIYNLLIGACGRWGYTKKAFQLYNQMKKRGVKVNDPTYTGLFNACSNSPWPEDGLKRAAHLRELMIEKGVEFNTTHYHAMIKAFGRCGDLNTAFALVDEMVNKHRRLTSWTFSVLLQACITDKEAGFRHSLLVWRKMLQKKIKPDLYTYNLMLRSVRDCGIGDAIVAQNVLEQIGKSVENISLPQGESASEVISDGTVPKSAMLEGSSSLVTVGEVCSQSEDKQLSDIYPTEAISRENRPNLLAPNPYLGNIIQLSEVTRPQDRLLLVGGYHGVLQLIADDGLTPDIKTFTLLLDSIPSTISAENALMSAMKKYGIQYDIDFFNMLIKKRSMRFDYENAREVLRLIQSARLHPDIVTFGVLALGCKTEDEAKQLIKDMRSAGYRMNTEILGAMLHQACIRHDFHYILKIMYISKEEQIKPNAQFLSYLENLNTSCWEILKNKNQDLDVPEYVRSKTFSKEFRNFSYKYRGWLKEIKAEEEVHPWEQFRKKLPENENQFQSIRRKN
ncbi:pentatricopeptide repeat-containing protein 1, mitochondrial [Anabrus simplex]|uniref:pentatricopeptide repeat-containing protein 1, mitochondrial n=1 Tax=Anabrus simplex TaxID=316456 RepID=UPI0035A30EEC